MEWVDHRNLPDRPPASAILNSLEMSQPLVGSSVGIRCELVHIGRILIRIVTKGRWLQGSGSSSPGRPVSSRQKISERLLADLAVVWERQRQEVLERLAKDEPASWRRLWDSAGPNSRAAHVRSINFPSVRQVSLRQSRSLSKPHIPPDTMRRTSSDMDAVGGGVQLIATLYSAREAQRAQISRI